MVWLWLGFGALILLLLALDLGVFHRKAHVVGVKEALAWSGVWVSLAMGFNVFIYFAYEYRWLGLSLPQAESDGWTAAVLFFTGYVVEKSLSVDNVFVIALLFAQLGVPARYQHRVLFWGIFGALLMRGAFIFAGAALLQRFDWMLYVFGGFLLWSAGRMLLARGEPDPKNSLPVRLARRWLPFTDEPAGDRFVVRLDGRWLLTPLALALLIVECSDLLFAVDSIPAIFAITTDPFLVFTSNVFAILGLRALYFALAGILDKFHYLKLSLALLLGLIGVKMLLKDVLDVVPGLAYWTLAVIAVILAGGVAASLVRARRLEANAQREAELVEPAAR